MYTTLAKILSVLGMAGVLAVSLPNNALANVIAAPPIITKLQKLKQPLSNETNKWMQRWVNTNLEDPGFEYPELSGTTGIYLKIYKIDSTADDGHRAYGTFVTGHGSSNPDTEIAYFNLAAIIGHDSIMRPAVPYAIGSKAAQAFKSLLEAELKVTEPGSRREFRINRLLDWLKTPPFIGGLKAKKQDSYIEYKMADIPAGAGRSDPSKDNPIIKALQATNPQPTTEETIELQKGYTGKLLGLAREFSIVMTFDALFQQWDRYNNTNVGIKRDDTGSAHFYMTDNGGADMGDLPEYLTAMNKNLKYFSRYDRKTIKKLKQIYIFLNNPKKGFMGYTSAEKFIVDLGLYSELKPVDYVKIFKRNLALLLKVVTANQKKYGDNIYLPD